MFDGIQGESATGLNISMLTLHRMFRLPGVCSGALRGAGLPTTASRVNLFSYWVVGLPVGAYATYKLQEIEGLWTGLALAMVFAASLMSFRLWK